MRPLKGFLPEFSKIEEEIRRIIFQHFGIKKYDKEELKLADNIALFTEMRDLMREPPKTWKGAEEYSSMLPEQRIIPLGPKESEKLFLERYRQLPTSVHYHLLKNRNY